MRALPDDWWPVTDPDQVELEDAELANALLWLVAVVSGLVLAFGAELLWAAR